MFDLAYGASAPICANGTPPGLEQMLPRPIEVHPFAYLSASRCLSALPHQPIVPATSAGHNPTLPTLIYVHRKNVMTFLASMPSGSRSPSCMRALMVRHQVLPLPLDEIYSVRSVNGAAIDNDIGPFNQPFFIPLFTAACFPAVATNVAEFGATAATWGLYELA